MGSGKAESKAEDPIFHHIIICRRDLPEGMRRAQITHAAGESASEWTLANGRRIPEHTHAISLLCKDEQELLEFCSKLEAQGIPHVLIREPDAPYCNQAMAVGLYPVVRTKNLRKLTSGFQLTEEKA